MAWSWARRSLAAATIFIALVIFCVDWTLRIRRRKVLRLGISTYARSGELLGEVDDKGAQLLFDVLGDLALLADRGKDRALGAQRVEQAGLEIADARDRQVVEMAAGAGEQRADLLFDQHRAELALLQQLGEALAARQQELGRGVEVRGELGEGRHFAILRQLQLDGAGDLLHRLDLGGRADAA